MGETSLQGDRPRGQHKASPASRWRRASWPLLLIVVCALKSTHTRSCRMFTRIGRPTGGVGQLTYLHKFELRLVSGALRAQSTPYQQVASTHNRVHQQTNNRDTFNYRPHIRQEYPLNLSILLSGGKESNSDFPSNGE